jgi:hypothetical protein
MQSEHMLDETLVPLQQGACHDPFGMLGRHRNGDREFVRAFMPQAERVELCGVGEMQRIPAAMSLNSH